MYVRRRSLSDQENMREWVWLAVWTALPMVFLVLGLSLVVTGCSKSAAGDTLTVKFIKSEYSYGNEATDREAKALAVEHADIFKPEVVVDGQEYTYTLSDPAKRDEAIAKLKEHPLLGPSMVEIDGEKPSG